MKTSLLAETAQQQKTIDLDLNRFVTDVSTALAIGAIDEPTPWIETSRPIIEHYNKGRMDKFDETHYFFFQGVKVYEQGKREASLNFESLTPEQRHLATYANK